MSLDKEDKLVVIGEYQKHSTDVGSAEVQIGIFSKRIEQLAAHLEKAPKDNHSRKGLVSLVSKRRKLLNYVKRVRPNDYGELISKLGLRR